MALDHRRLIGPGKKFRPNFLRSTSLFYKILPTNLGACKPTFYIIYTSHLRWNSIWGTVFIIQTSDSRMQYFTILRYKLLFRTIEARVSFSRKPLKKFSKSSIRPAGSDFYTVLAVASVWMNINRVTLQHNKEFIMFIF